MNFIQNFFVSELKTPTELVRNASFQAAESMQDSMVKAVGSVLNGPGNIIGNFVTGEPGNNSSSVTILPSEISGFPTVMSTITKSLSDIGPQGMVKDINDRFKIDFNTSHLTHIIPAFPDHMTMKTEMVDVYIYIMCAGVAGISLVGVMVAIFFRKRIKSLCRRHSTDLEVRFKSLQKFKISISNLLIYKNCFLQDSS